MSNKIGDSFNNIIEINNVLNKNDLEQLKEYCKIAQFNGGSDDINNFWHKRVEHKDNMPENIINILSYIFNNAKNKIEESYNIKIKDKPMGLNLTVWRPAMGMHPHIDDADYKDYNVAALFYINDNYFGGEINFIEFNHTIKPKENTLIIFPGHEKYKHEVKIVINGHRYTSSLWFSLDDLKEMEK